MSDTRVVNGHREAADVNITRRAGDQHYGNPFSHLATSRATVRVRTREEAIDRHCTWLDGTTDGDVEPERRAWILANLEALRGKRLGCFCKPQSCHGDNYIALLEARNELKVRAESFVRCDHCETGLATCRGSYEMLPEANACDECCGHGGEDGWCEELPQAVEVREMTGKTAGMEDA